MIDIYKNHDISTNFAAYISLILWGSGIDSHLIFIVILAIWVCKMFYYQMP